MFAYLGQLHATLYDFCKLFPPSQRVKKKLGNYNTFFMTLDLYGLPQEHVAICVQIWESLVNPSMTYISSLLLHVPHK